MRVGGAEVKKKEFFIRLGWLSEFYYEMSPQSALSYGLGQRRFADDFIPKTGTYGFRWRPVYKANKVRGGQVEDWVREGSSPPTTVETFRSVIGRRAMPQVPLFEEDPFFGIMATRDFPSTFQGANTEYCTVSPSSARESICKEIQQHV